MMESHVLAAALGALVPSVLLLQLTERQWARDLPPQCNGVLDREFWLSSTAVRPHLSCLGASGRRMYLDFYLFDFVLFPLIYSTALTGVLRRLWPRCRLLWLLPALGALCDVAENACILRLLLTFPERWELLERAVSLLTRTKWTLAFLAVAAVLAEVARRVLASATGGQKDKEE
ncbi:hypothetical protein BBJ28_00004926 [Nothophytophthora sp. Chile5]|nr:hypothetical protein BBJ28_00004926 [Nothophytophthora sp. Chile5]